MSQNSNILCKNFHITSPFRKGRNELDGNTQSYNRYSYCLNNPLIYTDPSGYVYYGYQQQQDAMWNNIDNFYKQQCAAIFNDNRNMRENWEFKSEWEGDWNPNAGDIQNSSGASAGNSGNVSSNSVTGYNSSYNFLGFHFSINTYTGALKYNNSNAIGSFKFSEPRLFIGNISYYFVPNSGTGLIYDPETYYLNIRQLSIRDNYDSKGMAENATLIPNDIANGVGLGTTMYGGSASWAGAELKAAGEIGRSVKYLKVGGNIVSGLGVAVSGYNVMAKYQNGTENTADWVDLGANSTLLVLGFYLSNPIGMGILVGTGIGYGIYRISGGDNADKWINDKFGYK